jgi:hypothetical protein
LKKLNNEDVHNLNSSQNIIRTIKSRGMRWVGNEAYMGEKGVHTGFWWGSQQKIDH